MGKKSEKEKNNITYNRKDGSGKHSLALIKTKRKDDALSVIKENSLFIISVAVSIRAVNCFFILFIAFRRKSPFFTLVLFDAHQFMLHCSRAVLSNKNWLAAVFRICETMLKSVKKQFSRRFVCRVDSKEI